MPLISGKKKGKWKIWDIWVVFYWKRLQLQLSIMWKRARPKRKPIPTSVIPEGVRAVAAQKELWRREFPEFPSTTPVATFWSKEGGVTSHWSSRVSGHLVPKSFCPGYFSPLFNKGEYYTHCLVPFPSGSGSYKAGEKSKQNSQSWNKECLPWNLIQMIQRRDWSEISEAGRGWEF